MAQSFSGAERVSAANPCYSSRLIGDNASKAALNMLAVQLAQELKDAVILANTVSRGFVKTDLTRGHGFVTPQEAVTGRFVSSTSEIPW